MWEEKLSNVSRSISEFRRSANLQRDAVFLEELLVLIHHTIEPWEELLGAVVGVEDNGDTVRGSESANVVGSGNGSSNGSLLVAVCDTLTSKVGGTTLGELERGKYFHAQLCAKQLSYLNDDRGLVVPGSLEGGHNGGGRSAVLIKVSVRPASAITIDGVYSRLRG